MGDFAGSQLSGAGFAAKTVSHGLAGGVISHLQGGRFGHGFAAAGVTASASPYIAGGFNGNRMAQGMLAAMVGGTASRLTGGKFANGAATGAMSYAFGRAAERVAATGSRTTAEGLDPSQIARPEIDYDSPYDSYGEAMSALEVAIAETRDGGNSDWEYGGIAVRRGDHHYISNVVTSADKHAIYWSLNTLDAISANAQIVALHHYHPLHRGVVPRAFSDADMATFRNFRKNYGPGFRAVYMMDRYGARRYDGTTNYRGTACNEGIALC